LRLKKITTRLIRDFFILFEIFRREEGGTEVGRGSLVVTHQGRWK